MSASPTDSGSITQSDGTVSSRRIVVVQWVLSALLFLRLVRPDWSWVPYLAGLLAALDILSTGHKGTPRGAPALGKAVVFGLVITTVYYVAPQIVGALADGWRYLFRLLF